MLIFASSRSGDGGGQSNHLFISSLTGSSALERYQLVPFTMHKVSSLAFRQTKSCPFLSLLCFCTGSLQGQGFIQSR